ncbi:MAG TPA: response regulator [Polyangiaceae bacterium]|nr:response regulator [Polyangiaceae bacterium]
MSIKEPPKRATTLDQTVRTARLVAQLTVVEGRAAGRKFKIEGSATIGRSPDAAVMLDDPEVSRIHARLTRNEAGAYLLEDLDSRNGTFINGVRAERRLLAYGDKIRVGPQVVLEFNGFDAVEDHIIQRQRFEAIGRLGVGIAHDLNNVLAALDASASYLRELPPDRILGDTEVRECITDLTLAAARASELTRGILSFVRGRGSERVAVDLSALVSEVVRMLRHTLEQGIRIEPTVDPNVIVHGSQSELHQVILNLCLNARDAMPDGGTLSISATSLASTPEFPAQPGRRVAVLSVADTGTGMDGATKARIFEPFFTTKREGVGYGLGLATVHEIVTLHGGQIKLDTELGSGSRFTVYLPIVDEAVRFSSTEERSAPLTRRPSGTVSILLVDDEQIVRRSVARLLRQAGFAVTEAADGAEAIALYSRRAHDLVVLDLDMPGIDGEQTQARLVVLDPYIRIVFASGHADPKREASVRARGALAFLQKPFGLETLIGLVNEVLASEIAGDYDEPTRPK